MKTLNNSTLICRAVVSATLIVSLTAFPIIKPSGASAVSNHSASNESSAKASGEAQDLGINFKSLPLRFELNVGQTDAAVRFIARNRDGIAFLASGETVLRVAGQTSASEQALRARSSRARLHTTNIESAVLRIHMIGSNEKARITGIDELPGTTNYFIGDDPMKWRTNVPSYARVKYEDIYAGTDLIYYGNEGNLEYDFNVAPGADPSRIAISVEGTDRVVVDSAGDLVLQTAVGEVRQRAPHIYQEENGIRREIAGGMRLEKMATSASILPLTMPAGLW